MSVKSTDDILAQMGELFKDNTDDNVLGFIEDITDTMNDHESRLADSTDWKEKYEQNDERNIRKDFSEKLTRLWKKNLNRKSPKFLVLKHLKNCLRRAKICLGELQLIR